MSKNIVILILIVGVGILGYLYLQKQPPVVGELSNGDEVPGAMDDEKNEISPTTRYFIEAMRAGAVARVGQPIEWFEPFMYLEAYPGLTAEDFDGVEALLGTYEVASGRISFNPSYKPGEPVHSAERAISDKGMDMLLGNISRRLNMIVGDEASVDNLLGEILEANMQAEVPVEKEFDSKIVYTTNAQVDTELLENDCNERGGTFNKCGTICAPTAELCAAVCAYTCEF